MNYGKSGRTFGGSWPQRAVVTGAVTTIMAFVLLMISSPAWAETFTVDSTEDTIDGRCSSGIIFFPLPTDDCTLREAVIAANNTWEDDQINLPSGTYNLAIRSEDGSAYHEQDAREGDLDILGHRGKTTIKGVGPTNTIINAREIDRIFDVREGANALIIGLKITGGAIHTGGYLDNGSAIRSQSTLNANNIVISENSGGRGLAAVYSTDIMRMRDVTVSDNVRGLELKGDGDNSENTKIYRSSVSHNSYGITNNGQELTVMDSTISGNERVGVAGDPGGDTTLINSTVTGNNINILHWAPNAKTRFLATIVSSPVRWGPDRGYNCFGTTEGYGTFTSDGHNLEYPGRSCGFTATGDVRNQNPLLRPLAYNGGRTKNHALRPASPAIDVARTLCSPRDQRYISRPKDGNGDGEKVCDIGAYEAPDVTDTARPTITGLRPTPGSSTRDLTPTIRATVRDNYTNLAKDNIKLYVDGRRKTSFSYNRNTERLSYTSRLGANRDHGVKIVAKDAAGNVKIRIWRFRVAR